MLHKAFISLLLLSSFVSGLESEANEFELSCETMNRFYRLWSDSWFGEDPRREQCAWIILNPQKGLEWKKWPASRELKKEKWKGKVPANVVAQVHTHPVNTDPRPSTKDQIFSRTVNAPLYTVSRKGIWKVSPSGKLTQIAGTNWHISLYKTRCKS